MTETQITETNAVPENAVPYFPHQAPPAVPLHKRGWFLPVALAAAVLFGAGGATAIAGTAAAAKSANCKVAFDYAETSMDASSNVISLLSDGLTDAANRDVDALNRLSEKIGTETKRLDGLPDKFKTAVELCK